MWYNVVIVLLFAITVHPIVITWSTIDQLVSQDRNCSSVGTFSTTINNFNTNVTGTFSSKIPLGGTICNPQLDSIVCCTVDYNVFMTESETAHTVYFILQGSCTAKCAIVLTTPNGPNLDCYSNCLKSLNQDSDWIEEHYVYFCSAKDNVESHIKMLPVFRN